MTLAEVFKDCGIAIRKMSGHKIAVRYIDGGMFIKDLDGINEVSPSAKARASKLTDWEPCRPGNPIATTMNAFLRKRADIANAKKGPGLIDSIRAADQVRGIRGLLHDMKLATLAQEEIYQYATKIRRSSINIELNEHLTNIITVATRLKESL